MTENSKKTSKILSTEPYKGVRDFYPEDWAAQEYIFSIWRKAVERFGFNAYNTSILEPADLYKAKSGDEMVNEQTYTFLDRGEREVTLRPEMTPSVARLIAAKRRDLGFPLRWYSIQNFFRYERPQRGRVREFWQLNADIFGLKGVEADIEIITLADAIMRDFGAKPTDYTIRISSRRLMSAIFNNWYELDESKSKAMQTLIDKKAKLPEDVFEEEAEKIVGKPFAFLNLTHGSADYQEAMAFTEIRDAKQELDQVLEELTKRGIKNATYDETLIRGFDYYTGIVFEVFDTNPENNRSLFGGGRFDELLALFGNDKVPATGFGMGDVTIKDFLETRGLLPTYISKAEIMICIMDESARAYADDVAAELRAQGKNIAVNYTYRPISDQFKSAEKQAIKSVIVIGENEANTRTYTIKELK